MYRNILLFLSLGWFASLAVTVLTYFLHTQPILTGGLLQWTTLMLLIFSCALSAVMGMRCHLGSSNTGLPTEIAFQVISKWGLRW